MSLENVRIVLVEPLYGGNVGSVCRAMANMGIERLAVVNAPALDLEEVRRLACHAGEIFEQRRECATLAEAVADCVAVYGTSVRGGLYRRHSRTPREWASEILSGSDAGPVALVFGREDKGLTNDEIALCTRLIRIPSSDGYGSLNLSHAVMVCCYELFLRNGTFVPPVEKSAPARSGLRERMFAMWEDVLLSIGFMTPEKASHMMQGVRRILDRGAYTEDDVNIMMGVARQMAWARRRPPENE